MRKVVLTALAVLISLLTLVPHAEGYEVDDTVPEVTDRVARISFIRGDVQIRRDRTDDWEKADLNLPIVEGDEISTDANGRLEIQFNGNTHLRLAENTSVQIRQLADGGVAVSVSRGVASVRLRKFNSEKEFFEIDAPGTTVALQREGAYKIAADAQNDGEVKVSVTDGGEARIYSANSGFTLKSGRSANVFVAGDQAGEWETADAGQFSDEFDSWTAERDDVIARSLKNAHYGKYYDQDIYGADELNDHGDWQYTNDYGFVWQPNQTAIRSYRDWSPYRYGSWRWVPPFGWTWVNDEPWGWATYHHGRWVWYRGRWAWTPYGYYRSNRSWWYPALVVVRVINRNICWYPLPYSYGYYNYNHSYHDYVGYRDRRRRPRDGDPRPGTGGTGSGGTGTGVVPPSRRPFERLPIEREPLPGETARKRFDPKPLDTVVPPTGVIFISAESFGVSKKIGSMAPPEVAKTALSKLDPRSQTPPELPAYQAVRSKMGREIAVTPPVAEKRVSSTTRLGAADRQQDVPLDVELRRSRMFGNRQPANISPVVTVPTEGQTTTRRTGAIERPPVPRRTIIPAPVERGGEQPPTDSSPVVKENPRLDLPPRREPKPREETPRFEPKPRDESPRLEPAPRRDPPKPREESPRVEPPRREPLPPKEETPRSDPPRREPSPPRQEQPRNDPPPRREAPPPKSDPPKANPPAPRSDPGAGSRKKEPAS